MFCFLFCVFCYFVLYCVLFLPVYIIVYFLSVHKFADHRHRVETQLQLINIISDTSFRHTRYKVSHNFVFI